MIEEAYVSFETAKLLKEKGFDEICNWYYKIDRLLIYIPNVVCSVAYSSLSADSRELFPRPTQQLVMRWLREVHSIFIELHHYDYPGAQFVWYIWGKNNYEPQRANTYEEAVEEAIKYCLENLIKKESI